jgi:hypothetical protein
MLLQTHVVYYAHLHAKTNRLRWKKVCHTLLESIEPMLLNVSVEPAVGAFVHYAF